MATPETESVEAFVQYLLDDERTSASFEEAEEVAESMKVHVAVVVRALKGYGVVVNRETEKRVRGFRTSSHDRYFGPGSSPSHGGSGWEQITGFAGQKG
jgi:hypothetical protein